MHHSALPVFDADNERGDALDNRFGDTVRIRGGNHACARIIRRDIFRGIAGIERCADFQGLRGGPRGTRRREDIITRKVDIRVLIEEDTEEPLDAAWRALLLIERTQTTDEPVG